MAKNYDKQKSLRNTGIFLVVIAIFVLLALIWAVIRNAGYAKKYTVAVNGTVISSYVYYEYDHDHKEPHSNVTIQYEGLNGSLHTIKRNQLYGEYKEGETVSLKCNEERDKAVLKQDTEQNPIFIGCLSAISLFFGTVGILLIKGKANG